MRGWLRGVGGALIALASSCALAQPKGGEAASFPSPDARGATTALPAMLWRPSTPSTAAVVLVHGSAGWTDEREGHYARALAQAGFTVLAFDAFGPRGASNTVDDQARVSSMQLARDALAAGRYLATQGFPMSRQAVMGWSKGGAAALFAADLTFLTAEPTRFAVTVAFYPACSTRPRHPKPASTIFLALAELDDYAGVKPCQELAADIRAAGGDVTTTIYPGAAHDFDGDPARTGRLHLRHAENYMDCRLLVEDDGSMTLGERRFRANDPGVLAAMKGSCMRRGASIWTDQGQKVRATADVVGFLQRALDAAGR